MSGTLKKDDNDYPVSGGVSSTDANAVLPFTIDPVTGRVLADIPGASSGTVTSVSVVSANGFAGTVATATTTPAITLTTSITGLLKGNGTAIGAASDGTDYLSSTTGITASQTTPQTVGDTTHRLANLWVESITCTNAISGSVTGNAGTVTGLSFASGKTLTVNNILTLAGTDSTTMTFPSTSASIARTDAAQTFTGTQTFSQIVTTNNAITAIGNAATVPITSRISTVTNNSDATLTITMTTTSAVDGQMVMVRILDFSAAAQTITWVNTENSNTSAPTTSNGSTTLPLTVGFQYNGNTSKWRCIANS